MIKALKTLFSSGELMDNVSNGLDKAILTPQERLENFNRLLALYEPFKIAQRYLAMIFCIPYAVAWMIIILCAVITFAAGFIWPNTAPMWENIGKMVELLKGDIGTIVLTIVIFYFGGGALEGVVGKFKSMGK